MSSLLNNNQVIKQGHQHHVPQPLQTPHSSHFVLCLMRPFYRVCTKGFFALWLLTGFDQCEALEETRQLEEDQVREVMSPPPTS